MYSTYPYFIENKQPVNNFGVNVLCFIQQYYIVILRYWRFDIIGYVEPMTHFQDFQVILKRMLQNY